MPSIKSVRCNVGHVIIPVIHFSFSSFTTPIFPTSLAYFPRALSSLLFTGHNWTLAANAIASKISTFPRRVRIIPSFCILEQIRATCTREAFTAEAKFSCDIAIYPLF